MGMAASYETVCYACFPSCISLSRFYPSFLWSFSYLTNCPKENKSPKTCFSHFHFSICLFTHTYLHIKTRTYSNKFTLTHSSRWNNQEKFKWKSHYANNYPFVNLIVFSTMKYLKTVFKLFEKCSVFDLSIFSFF